MCIRDRLYRQQFEHDNCGIGACVNIKGTKSRATVENALKIVENLEHRAGTVSYTHLADGQVSWHEVNFFENSFSEDVGNILFGHPSGGGEVSLMSPDNTSDGWLKKKWTIMDGKRFLLKGGSGATQQEPYNEVLASRIMEQLHICLLYTSRCV